jgi:thiol:disulfide interchange protein DsbD
MNTDTKPISLVENKALVESDISSITAILESGSMVFQLLIFFALGLGLAFTPCVFPMIPILSSIIVGQGESLTTRRAFAMSLSYVLAMAVTYAIAGVIVGYFGATANVAIYLQNPWVLGTFAAIFVLLSLSMFGLYELALPRFIHDKLSNAQQKQQGGRLISVAIMGSLSALVVSPCVSAPLAGTLVYISTTGDALLGGLALLALGLGMGVPLLIIGTGGGKFLTKAGMWMDGVKNVFGVALLAVAIWLLERVIPASTTLMLWAILQIGSGIFLGALEQGTKGWKLLFKAVGVVFSI